jgi:carboxypeptidase Taq
MGADHPGAAFVGLSGGGIDSRGNGMKNNTAYAELMAYQRQTEALSKVAERLGWDQETMMPRGGAEQRGEEMAAIEGVLHARRTNPQIAQWLADAEAVDEAAAAQLYQIDRSYTRSVKVPGDLAQELARLTSVAQGIWAGARAADKVADFLPTLVQVIDLKRFGGAEGQLSAGRAVAAGARSGLGLWL